MDGSCLHELLPIPFTREAVRHTITRVRELQSRLPVPLLLENITYYAELGAAEMEEADFITAVLEGADVGWLLDVNNVYVNALNFGFDPKEWLSRMPLDRVAQLHIAGHKKFGDHHRGYPRRRGHRSRHRPDAVGPFAASGGPCRCSLNGTTTSLISTSSWPSGRASSTPMTRRWC